MTFLDLVNAVLGRMRERPVTDVSSTDESKLAAYHLNDAKRIVEDSWDWSALRVDTAVPTVASTSTYTLTGAGNNVKIDNVTISGSVPGVLKQKTKSWLTRAQLDAAPESQPVYWIFDGVDASGDTQITLYPTPDAVYNVNIDGWIRQPDLSANTDVLLIPSFPVIMLAVALYSRERGEIGGQHSVEAFQVANTALGDAISHDHGKEPWNTDWHVM